MLNRRSLVPAGVVALVAGAVFFFQSFTSAQTPAKPERVVWEYKTVRGNQTDDALNAIGSEGWELVAVEPGLPYPQKSDINPRLFYFKRPK